MFLYVSILFILLAFICVHILLLSFLFNVTFHILYSLFSSYGRCWLYNRKNFSQWTKQTSTMCQGLQRLGIQSPQYSATLSSIVGKGGRIRVGYSKESAT